jgi:hypothetical protein
MNHPDFTSEDVARAVALMADAGWIEKSRVTPDFSETWFTEYGLTRAKQMLRAFLDLDCQSDRDLRCVIGVYPRPFLRCVPPFQAVT